MKTKVQDNVPRRASVPPGEMREQSIGHRSMLAMAMLLLLMWFMPQRALADYIDDFKNSTKIDDSHLNDGGYISVSFMIYNSQGRDDGIDPDWHKSHIDIDGTPVFYIRSLTDHDEPQRQDNSGYRWAQVFRTTSDKVARVETQVVTNVSTKVQEWVEVTKTNPNFESNSTNDNASSYHKFNYVEPGKESYTYAEFRIYPSASWLKTKGTDGVTISGSFYIDCTDKDAGSRDDFDVSVTPKTCFVTLPKAPALTVDFSQNAGKQSVTFSGTQGDKYTITNKSQTTIGNSGTISIDYDVQNTARTVSLTYYKRLSDYQYLDVSSTVTIPAYQHPDDFKATQLADGDVQLTWSIPSYNGSTVTGGDFEVQRSKDVGFATSETVGSLTFNGAKSYTLTDDVSEKNLNGKYYYRLRRTNAAAWNWSFVKTTWIDLRMSHQRIASARGEITASGKIKLTWSFDNGNVWTENSSVMVERTNTNKGTSTTYTIAEDNTTTSYEETLPTTCDVYTYTIYVKPGNSVYATQTPVLVASDGNLYSTSMGYVSTATASKGYYSDRVSLEWEVEGGSVDQFSIRAREYGSNSEWKQIEEINANVASTSYQYSDTKAVPGVIYEYSIVAVKNCGGDNDQIPYEGEIIGFRTPTGDIYGRVTFENGQAVADVEVRAEIAEGDLFAEGLEMHFEGVKDQQTLQLLSATD